MSPPVALCQMILSQGTSPSMLAHNQLMWHYFHHNGTKTFLLQFLEHQKQEDLGRMVNLPGKSMKFVQIQKK